MNEVARRGAVRPAQSRHPRDPKRQSGRAGIADRGCATAAATAATLAAEFGALDLFERLAAIRSASPAGSYSRRASALRTRRSRTRSFRKASRSRWRRSIPAGCFRKRTKCGRKPSGATASAFVPWRRSTARRSPGRPPGHRRFPLLGRGASRLLRGAQGRAARPRARRRRRLDHRHSRRSIGRPGAVFARRVRRRRAA